MLVAIQQKDMPTHSFKTDAVYYRSIYKPRFFFGSESLYMISRFRLSLGVGTF